MLKGLTKVVGRYGLRLVKTTPAEWVLLTNLNKEIFKYSVDSKLFRLNASFKRGLGSTIPIYRILDAPVATANGITEKGIIQLSKDASGNVIWEFIGNSVLKPVRGISFDEFMRRTPSLVQNAPIEISQQAFKLWSTEQWIALYQLMEKHVKSNVVWPPMDGAVGPIIRKEISPDTPFSILDRFDSYADDIRIAEGSQGIFVSPLQTPQIPYTNRALDPGKAYSYYKIRVLKKIYVEESPVIPWFGEKGLGIQYKIIDGTTGQPKTINQLFRDESIELFDFEPKLKYR